MNCLVREARTVLHSWFGKCRCGLHYKRDIKKLRKDLFSALVSDTAEISQGSKVQIHGGVLKQVK